MNFVVKKGDLLEEKTILLVEDNQDDVILTKRALKKANILNKIVVCSDGIEALEYLRDEGEFSNKETQGYPEVILLDLKMPRMSGIEFLKEIRNDPKLRFIPVVILTSSKEEQDVIESYDMGANSYIRKPVDFDQFVAAIQTLGLYWLVLNIAPKGGT